MRLHHWLFALALYAAAVGTWALFDVAILSRIAPAPDAPPVWTKPRRIFT